MSKKRVDYSDLVFALQENNEGKANELLNEILPRLKDYLQVTMDASAKDAEECVHMAFSRVYEKIVKNKIRKEKYIYAYLLKSCRNEYVKYIKHQHRFISPDDNDPNYILNTAEQIENLLDKDRQRILEECLDMLEDKARRFIEFFIDKPDADTKEAQKYFKISNANVRTRKSRIVSRLHHCFKRKWEQ